MIADNIDYLERGFKNVVEYGKANGIPGILLKGAVELPRSEVSVMHDAAAGGGGGGEGGGAGALGAGAGP